MLLKERKVLDRAKKPVDAGTARASGASGSGASGSGAEAGDAGQTSAGDDGSQGGGGVGGGSGGEPAPETESRVPGDVSDGHDDDVVARQLREAAMAEDDPELRERLWDEYRAYKSGRRAPSRPADSAQDPETSSDGEAGDTR